MELRVDHSVTLQETTNFVESCSNAASATVTILPPECGDQDIPRDEEDFEFGEEDQSFEPAGEMKIVAISISDNDEEEFYHTGNRRDSPRWKKQETFAKTILGEEMSSNIEEKFPEHLTKSCYEIWKLYFTDELFHYILEQTKLYAKQNKNDARFELSLDELKNFIEILIFSGYHFVTSETDYWSNQPDLKAPFISETMSGERFLKIKKYFHVADNQNLKNDHKVAKVAFLYEAMNKNLSQWGIFHKILSIDEAMVPYFGKHSAKMYIKDKPIRFGYKI